MPRLEDPRIIVKRAKRELQIFDGEKLFKTYKIALGFAPFGDKEIEGDGKTPEGEFYIFAKNSESKFYLSIGVSYPNFKNAKRGLKNQLISTEEYEKIVKLINEQKMPLQNSKLGGEIYIHGGGNFTDWTKGCVALKNEEMKELFDIIPIRTPVLIKP